MIKTMDLTYRFYESMLDLSFKQVRKWTGSFEETYRRNRTVVRAGRIRNTYDTGFLQKGRRRVFVTGLWAGTTYRGVPYSWKVFMGFKPMGTPVPPRPLPKIVAAEMEWSTEFKKQWGKN
jgi:hypothetical protein